jgi:hypothetical protein
MHQTETLSHVEREADLGGGLPPELIELIPDREKTIAHLSQLLGERRYVLGSVILKEHGSLPCILDCSGQMRQSLFERYVRQAVAPFAQFADA